MFVVYAIRSAKDGRIYVGLTENLERRVKEHNSGKVFSTKGFRPWILIHVETAASRQDAWKREKYLKSGIGKELLKSKIPG